MFYIDNNVYFKFLMFDVWIVFWLMILRVCFDLNFIVKKIELFNYFVKFGWFYVLWYYIVIIGKLWW